MTEKEYFDTTVASVLVKTGYSIDIQMLDHMTLDGKHKRALGCCCQFDGHYSITIDEYFVTECFEHFVLKNKYSSWNLTGQSLEEVICHELAHIEVWRHGKKHTALMNDLLAKVNSNT